MELLNIDDRNGVTSRDIWLQIKRDELGLIHLKVRAPGPTFTRNQIIEDTEIGEVGRDIGRNTKLREIFLGGNSSRQFQLLCEGFHENRSIHYVRWDRGRLQSDMFQSLTPFLESNTNLLGMEFMHCRFDPGGMHSLMAPLMRRGRPLPRLNLSFNGIDDDLAEELVMGVRENPALTPKRIHLIGNNISEIGCGLIATLLQDPRCTMEELILIGNRVNDASAMLFSDALVGNKKLRVLSLGDRAFTATGSRAMSQLLCDTTNINTTYASNHTLLDLRLTDNIIRSELLQYLGWNRNRNKNRKMVARQKVFMKHFIENFKMEPFEGIHPDLLDRVLDFMNRASVENGGVTNANARHSILYGLIKNNPIVCDITKPGNDCKRKHV